VCDGVVTSVTVDGFGPLTSLGDFPAWEDAGCSECNRIPFGPSEAFKVLKIKHSTSPEISPICDSRNSPDYEVENISYRQYLIITDQAVAEIPPPPCCYRIGVKIFILQCYRVRPTGGGDWEYGCCACALGGYLRVCFTFRDINGNETSDPDAAVSADAAITTVINFDDCPVSVGIIDVTGWWTGLSLPIDPWTQAISGTIVDYEGNSHTLNFTVTICEEDI
jgi:hypothetical protein